MKTDPYHTFVSAPTEDTEHIPNNILVRKDYEFGQRSHHTYIK